MNVTVKISGYWDFFLGGGEGMEVYPRVTLDKCQILLLVFSEQ